MQGSMIIHPEELSLEWIDRLADAGVGTLGIHPRGGKVAIESLKELLQMAQTAEYRRLIDYAHSRGLRVEYEIHAAGYLLPRELFDQHPTYFRTNREGQPTADHNFCVSNPDAMELVAKRAAELAQALYGSDDAFYFWLDDGRDFHCHCPKCRGLSPSDQQLMVLNRMVKEIRKQIPTARLAYLAYMDTVAPPTQVQKEAGIFLEYAPFYKYTAKGEEAEALIAEEKASVAPLLSLFADQPKKVLEYWYDNSLYSNWQKPPVKFTLNQAAMEADIAEYQAMGFDEVATFACFLGADYRKLHGEVDITPFSRCVL